jgi:hypothetical protein
MAKFSFTMVLEVAIGVALGMILVKLVSPWLASAGLSSLENTYEA